MTIGTNGFVTSVDTYYDGTIRIIGDRSTGIPSAVENLYINWTAPPDNGGSTMLDLLVYVLADEDNYTIGYPEGFPAYVYVTYSSPTPTPSPDLTSRPDETPTPTPDPNVTPVPGETPEDTYPPEFTSEPEPSPTPSPEITPEATPTPYSTIIMLTVPVQVSRD